MANKTTSALTASKKELSSIVSNILAEQQKINERIAALEQNVGLRSVPSPMPIQARVKITEEDIDKGIARFLKKNILHLSNSNMQDLAERVKEGVMNYFNSTVANHADVLRTLNENDMAHYKEIKRIGERLADIEQRQNEEEQKAKAAAKGCKARLIATALCTLFVMLLAVFFIHLSDSSICFLCNRAHNKQWQK